MRMELPDESEEEFDELSDHPFLLPFLDFRERSLFCASSFFPVSPSFYPLP